MIADSAPFPRWSSGSCPSVAANAAEPALLLCVGGGALRSAVPTTTVAAWNVRWWTGDDLAAKELYHVAPAVVLIEIGGGTLRQPARLVRLPKHRWPNAYLIGYCWLGARASDDLVLAVRAGLDAIAFEGCNDVHRLVRLGFAARAGHVESTSLLTSSAQTLHPLALRVAEHVLARTADAPNVNDLARAVCCTPRALERRFARAGLPTPGRLVTELRWLRTAELLATRRFKNSEVACMSGFSNARAMRAALKRRLRMSLKELANADAVDRLRQRLLADFSV